MQTMAKHFGHKIPVEFDEESAVMRFDAGAAHARVTDAGLHLSVESESADGVLQLADVVGRHLLRFAHRDDPQPIDWSPAA